MAMAGKRARGRALGSVLTFFLPQNIPRKKCKTDPDAGAGLTPTLLHFCSRPFNFLVSESEMASNSRL